MKQIGAAVIGLGGNGTDAVRTALSSPFVKRVVGVDINANQCAKAKQQFGIQTESSLDGILQDPEIELVFISTSNASHYPIAVAGLRAGKKVFTEKPMGINLEETEDLLKIVRQTNGWLGVGFELRHYSKLYQRVKDIVDSGEIGKLKHINCQYSISPFGNENGSDCWKFSKTLSGGLFQEKLCHYIDLPRWWDGTRVKRYFITKADNVIPYYEVADNFELTYQFESGVVSHLTFTMNAAGAGAGDLIDTGDLTRQISEGYRLSYQAIGTEGAVEANIFSRELRLFHHPGKAGMGGKSKMVSVERWEQKDDHAYFHNTTDEKLDAARRVAEGLPPAIDPEDAAETMRLCYEFEEAACGPWKVVER